MYEEHNVSLFKIEHEIFITAPVTPAAVWSVLPCCFHHSLNHLLKCITVYYVASMACEEYGQWSCNMMVFLCLSLFVCTSCYMLCPLLSVGMMMITFLVGIRRDTPGRPSQLGPQRIFHWLRDQQTVQPVHFLALIRLQLAFSSVYFKFSGQPNFSK